MIYPVLDWQIVLLLVVVLILEMFFFPYSSALVGVIGRVSLSLRRCLGFLYNALFAPLSLVSFQPVLHD